MQEIAMAGEPPTKCRKTDDDNGFSPDTDLSVVVEDEKFEVHSVIFAMVSPVFRAMLAAPMAERMNKEIFLPDKKKEEFRVFWNVLQPMSTTALTKDNAEFLSRWAEEYQVSLLKTRCEDFMMEHSKVDVAGVQHALRYGLPRRFAQCIREISADLPQHMDELTRLGKDMPEELLQRLWPSICEKAGIPLFDMPALEKVHSMWPFIEASVRSYQRVAELKVAEAAGTPIKLLCHSSIPRRAQTMLASRTFSTACLMVSSRKW